MSQRKQNTRKIAANIRFSIQQFDVADYVQNPPMIKKLNEEKEIALAISVQREEKLEEQRLELERCKRDIEVMKVQLLHAEAKSVDLKQRALLKTILSFIATLALGVGINLITSTLFSVYGLLFLCFSIIIHASIYFFMSLPKGQEKQ